MKTLRRLVPILEWLPRYQGAWLRPDVMAGLAVWAMVVPQSMAYASVAGMPPVYGLYSVPLVMAGYALFGSSDRKVYIYTYPDLEPAGELQIHRPPWNEKTGTRIWPNVIPLPEGYPARYIALMMDRLNFPGMQGANWTYGAMYLYHAHPAGCDQLDY